MNIVIIAKDVDFSGFNRPKCHYIAVSLVVFLLIFQLFCFDQQTLFGPRPMVVYLIVSHLLFIQLINIWSIVCISFAFVAKLP